MATDDAYSYDDGDDDFDDDETHNSNSIHVRLMTRFTSNFKVLRVTRLSYWLEHTNIPEHETRPRVVARRGGLKCSSPQLSRSKSRRRNSDTPCPPYRPKTNHNRSYKTSRAPVFPSTCPWSYSQASNRERRVREFLTSCWERPKCCSNSVWYSPLGAAGEFHVSMLAVPPSRSSYPDEPIYTKKHNGRGRASPHLPPASTTPGPKALET